MSGLSAIQTMVDVVLAPLRAFADEDEDDFLDPASEKTSEMVSFIREYFQKKVCCNFVAAECNDEAEDGDPMVHQQNIMCVCGSAKKDHPNVALDPQTPSYMSQMSLEGDYPSYIVEELKTTDAFGQIKFLPHSISYQEPAQYLRLADNADPMLTSTVLRLMCDFWHLADPDPPSLVISLAPSGNLYCLSDLQSKEIFNRGLVKAIKSTNGWLITGGLNMGVAKAVGAAVQEGQTLEWNANQDLEGQNAIKCIGIATWSQVQNKELLTNKHSNKPNFVDYLVDPAAREGEPVSLNSNHSHFLLVDTGVSSSYQISTQGNAEFRADLERQITLPRENGGLDVPVVCLMVEGGLQSLEQVLNSVKQGTHAVVCAHTGRAAGVLAWAVEQYRQILRLNDVYNREREEYELRCLVKERARSHEILKREEGDSGYDAIADIVIEICYFQEQITIFRIEENHSLDEALLMSILDSQHKGSAINYITLARKLASLTDPLKQLQLAQRWDRADVASRILTDPRYFFLSTNKNVDKLMLNFEQALIEDQVDFVRLYLDSGVPVKRFMTADRLRKLYSETVITARYLWKRFGFESGIARKDRMTRKSTLKDRVDSLSLKNVNLALQSFGKRFGKTEYKDSSCKTFSEPLHHLFIWAVLLNREDLAILLWERCSNPINTAIAGTVLCKYLSNLRGEAQASLRTKFAKFRA